MRAQTSQADALQGIRYLINGLLATAVHFALLVFNLRIVGMGSAGVASACAAVGGIAVSFMGSRYFVFRRHDRPMLRQATRFGILYVSIALLHGLILYAWTDMLGQDYRIGFLGATALQMLASYWGNRFLVFAP